MADKQCPQCSETVDVAKAFCPACGHAFVAEEERRDSSNYESHDSTMQMGQTMYNSMLSDMGLNVGRAPDPKPEQPKQVILQPAISLQPAAPAIAPALPPPPQEKKSNSKIWLITILVALALMLILAAAVIAVAAYLYFRAGKV